MSNPRIDLRPALEKLQSVSDQALQQELKRINLKISETKRELAFSSYGFTRWLTHPSVEDLSEIGPSLPSGMPLDALDSIRQKSVFLFRGYIALVFMRSDHLECGLDDIGDGSPIAPFRDFFRSGSIKSGDDTIAQHLRNALSHGSVEFIDSTTAGFIDRRWVGVISPSDFVHGLCEEVFRFYCAAQEVSSSGV